MKDKRKGVQGKKEKKGNVGSPLAQFMENVIGPSYVILGDIMWGGGYVVHEYFCPCGIQVIVC